MLRGEGGELWYRNMGFGGTLNKNKSVTIDIIIMITGDREKELLSHLDEFNDPLNLRDENIILRPYVAYYEWDKLKGKVNIQKHMDLRKHLKNK